MEVSTVSTNPNCPHGGDHGNRTGNTSYAETVNDPRCGSYTADPRCQNYHYPQQQYQPDEREYVVSRGPCSHCQAHCSQKPTDYQNKPVGSRGERLDRYIANVQNEYASVGTETVREVPPKTPISHDLGLTAHPESCNVQQEAPKHEVVLPPQQVKECCSIPQQPIGSCKYCNLYNSPVRNYNNDCHQYHTETVSPSPVSASHTCYEMAPPLIGEERDTKPISSNPRIDSIEPNIVQSDPIPCDPRPIIAQSMPVQESRGLRTKDSVESLMAPRKTSPTRNTDTVFSPSSMTHLNFKEKQLAMSAVKKAAANMNCIQMFQDKDKNNCGKIGKRDFQMVMDRLGVLRGMSSREIDAVFKGFSTQTDTEIDYRKFSEACKHAVDNDHRLPRMAQK